MIHLAVGRLEIDGGRIRASATIPRSSKGSGTSPTCLLYVGEEDGTDFEGKKKWKPVIEHKEGLSKPLLLVVERLKLLGHTYAQCEKEFAFLARLKTSMKNALLLLPCATCWQPWMLGLFPLITARAMRTSEVLPPRDCSPTWP